MKLTQLFSFLIALCCSAYGIENKHIFAGQIQEDGVMKQAFLLEILDAAMDNRVVISENGEVWIKVDKIVTVPTLQMDNLMTPPIQNQYSSEISYRNKSDIQCSKCKYWYTPHTCNDRKCPNCGKSN